MLRQWKFKSGFCGKLLIFLCIAVIFLCGDFVFAGEPASSALQRYRVFRLKHISAEQGREYLAKAKIGTVSSLPDSDTLLVTAEPSELIKASAIIKLVDSENEFVIEAIAPAAGANNLPSNEAIAAKLGGISIGTFLQPPPADAESRAIIDIHQDSVMIVAPADIIENIFSAIETYAAEKDVEQVQQPKAEDLVLTGPNQPAKSNQIDQPEGRISPQADDVNARRSDELFEKLLGSLNQAEKKASEPEKVTAEPNETQELAEAEPNVPPVSAAGQEPSEQAAAKAEQQLKETIETPEIEEIAEEPEAETAVEPDEAEVAEPATVPSYQPEPITGGEEMLELDLPEKLNIIDLLDLVGKYLGLDYMYDEGKVQGEVSLRLQGPIKVKDLYPLLESVLKFKGFVMTRKGNLVIIVPAGEALNIDPALHTDRGMIELGDVIITRIFDLQYIDTTSAKNLLDQMKLGANITAVDKTGTLIVTEYAYRMGRIEELLEMIDRPGPPKQFRFRQLRYTMAKTLAPKVKTLADQLGTVSVSISAPAKPAPRAGRARPRPQPKPTAEAAEPTVYLDADERTNRILMIGLVEQLDVVEELIDALDVEQQDLRTLRVYEIQHIDADEVRDKLQQLGIIGGAREAGPGAARARTAKSDKPEPAAVAAAGDVLTEEPQVIVLESTNSLLVNATAEQHAQIAMIIGYVDSETLELAIPYVIYPLENQNPEDLAEVLQKLIQETIEDKEGKIQRVVKKQEDIVNDPDESTFSIIVYASRKNQEWISSLIKTLDKRRPQVLIDVTLVEVTKTDLFDLDLQLASKFPTLEAGGEMDVVGAVISPFLQKSSTEAFSHPFEGKAQGFYSDRHIQALLTAIQTKSYGRVLAKPKILVNDGQPGIIKTTETKHVKFEDFISGGPDKPDQTIVRYQPYPAGITLTITPNISEGDLLLLEVELIRSDFGEAPAADSPPDTTESNIKTTVTVPNDRTIILGGLIKLNQTKGGTKVPLLGDIPLVGGLFRSTANSARDSKLYIFVKANILRPYETLTGLPELERISARNAAAFERAERQFQEHQDWPGIKPKPVEPLRVLEAE